MTNARNKSLDNTHLSVDLAEERGFIHRDYIAHCLRWSHVVKFLMSGKRYQTAHVLDVGCGKELPLAKLMYSNKMTHTIGTYTGVEYNKVKSIKFSEKMNLDIYDETNFLEWPESRSMYDVEVSFEVLEHVELITAYKILRKMRLLLATDGDCFISTPVYDPHVGAAGNHVNEMSYECMRYLIHAAGFRIENVYGTFASQRDILPHLNESEKEVFNDLKRYYDSNLVACLLAPNHPTHSRNCLWHLVPGTRRLIPINCTIFGSSEKFSQHLETLNAKLQDVIKTP